jgi:uncharacterized paraquat-inducible protein A
MTETPLFENRRYCEECHCLLPTSYEGTLCPRCLEQELFHQVKVGNVRSSQFFHCK